MKKIRCTIYLLVAVDREIRARAERRGISISEVVNEAILGGPPAPAAEGESWRMPSAPIGAAYVPPRR